MASTAAAWQPHTEDATLDFQVTTIVTGEPLYFADAEGNGYKLIAILEYRCQMFAA